MPASVCFVKTESMRGIALFFILFQSIPMFGSTVFLPATVYLSNQSMLKSVYGSEKVAAVGNNGQRHFYKNYKLDSDTSKFLELAGVVVLSDFPFAVLAGNQLLNKDDDLCTFIPEVYRDVDITYSCIQHDFCWFTLGDYRSNKSFEDAYSICNTEFGKHLKMQAQNQRPRRRLVNFGWTFVKFMGFAKVFKNYIMNQDKAALLYSKLLEAASENKSLLHHWQNSRLQSPKLSFNKVSAYCETLESDRPFLRKTNLAVNYPSHPRDNLKAGELRACEHFFGWSRKLSTGKMAAL
ncbi:MAG: hypothetical protein AB8E15_08975 [Bdellovibrionales bacterium]